MSDRSRLLRQIERNPSDMWPVKLLLWSFQNRTKVYGSPQLDAAIARSKGESGEALQTLLDELRAVTWA